MSKNEQNRNSENCFYIGLNLLVPLAMMQTHKIQRGAKSLGRKIQNINFSD